jgi:hypothetical protein
LNLTSSAFFSILVNGVPSHPFLASRGIRQGDPLSPFLFVLMAEGLGRYIKSAVLEGALKGLPLHNIRPTPSHNQFIDDTLLMNSPTACKSLKLNSILSDFIEASGMTLNLDKSKIFFFNTPVAIQIHISKILGIPRSSLPSNYLDIPLTGVLAKSISWGTLLLCISNRLANWTFRPLNITARLVLLKSVLQTLPTYLFTALAAPKQIIRAIRNIQRNFLWQGLQPNKKWALVRWDKVYTPKSMAGLRLQDPGKLNQIMGAKIWWRWMKTPDVLWAQFWKNKYPPSMQSDQLIRHNVRIQGSNIWNIAWQNKDIIQKHSFWEICNGDSTGFWQDSWQQLKPLNELAELTPLQQALNQAPSLKVNDLWKPLEASQTWRQWNTSSQDLGTPPDLNLSSWHYEAGRGKSPLRRGQTSSDGGTPLLAIFR